MIFIKKLSLLVLAAATVAAWKFDAPLELTVALWFTIGILAMIYLFQNIAQVNHTTLAQALRLPLSLPDACLAMLYTVCSPLALLIALFIPSKTADP